ESMIRELADSAINMVRGEREDEVYPTAEARAEDRLLHLLLPTTPLAGEAGGAAGAAEGAATPQRGLFVVSSKGEARPESSAAHPGPPAEAERQRRTREKLRQLLQD